MVDWNKVQKVLIIKFLGIGDVLFTTPMVRKLSEEYPHLNITYLTSTLCAPVLRNNSNINTVLTYDMPPLKTLVRHPGSLLSVLFLLRKKGFDVTIIAHRSLSSILFAYFTGSPIRIGFDYKGRGFLLNSKVLLKKNEYAPALYMKLLQDVCGDKDNLGLELNPTREEVAFAREVFSSVQGDTIAVAPGGGKNAWMTMLCKRWTQQGYAEIISRLSGKHNILILGSKDDVEVSTAIKKNISCPVIDLTGKTTLCQASAVLQQCRLFIGCDSSLLHIAAAMGTPTVSIFGPTNPEYFAPKGDKHVVVKSETACGPCFTYGESPKCEDNVCMKSIRAEDVLSAVGELLNQ